MSSHAETIILFEDECALTLEPLTLTRPVWELRGGILTLREKIERHFPGRKFLSSARDYLQVNNAAVDHPENLWINGALLPDEGLVDILALKSGEAWMDGERLIAFRGIKPEGWKAGTQPPLQKFKEVKPPGNWGKLIRYTWDLVNLVNREVSREAHDLRQLGRLRGLLHSSTILIQEREIFVGEGCNIGPGVVLDASAGPIVLDENVLIGSNAVVEGPTYLGAGSQVKPLTHIRGSCLGEQSRAGGEISVSIMQGYSNKAHGGFLGHSFLGSWCNLGSGTETSNLKNNYSPVKVQVGSQLVDTGQLFVGLTMGDHSKSAIGSIFNTGTVVGVGCVIFGNGFPPRYVPSFNWGGSEKLTPYHLKPTLVTAEEMMKRRGKSLTQEDIDILTWVHHNRSSIPGR